MSKAQGNAKDTVIDEDWYSEATATFGDRLAGAREAAGMTQADLARRLGVKIKTLRAWEDDLSEPRANRLSMLAGLLNVSIMWLLTSEGEGIDVPDAARGPATQADDLLLELREIKADSARMTARLEQLEKRLCAVAAGAEL